STAAEPSRRRGPGEGVNAAHGRGSGQGERAHRERHPSLQETVRESRYSRRAAQAGALREAERQAEEEGDGGPQARPTPRRPHARLGPPSAPPRVRAPALGQEDVREPGRRAPRRPPGSFRAQGIRARLLPRERRARRVARRRARGGGLGPGSRGRARRAPPPAAGPGRRDRVRGALRRRQPDNPSARRSGRPRRPGALPRDRQPRRRGRLRACQGGGPPRLRAPARPAPGPVRRARRGDRGLAARAAADGAGHGRGERRTNPEPFEPREPRRGQPARLRTGMAGRIRDDAIRGIRERASLVEVVSDVVALRRRGRSFVGLCPFHAEKTPSFTVSEERGFFHCFGCGEHGDVFAFVMRIESQPFPDAVRRVASRFGLPVPEDDGGGRPRGEPLVAVNAAAAAFFQSELAGAGGTRARAYLAERGVGEEAVRRFGLGYAPPNGDALFRYLRGRGYPIEDCLTAGLVLRRDRPGASGGLLDRFRDRLMFPIADPTSRIVAFGGRILPGRPVSDDP